MSNQHTVNRPFYVSDLRRDYEELVMSQVEIAKKYGTTQKVVWSAMRAFGIPARKTAKRDQRSSLNTSWKGTGAGYQALHVRVGRLRGKPMKCERCDRTGPEHNYDWANLSGRFDDPSDYQRMCRSCHRRYDNARRKAAVQREVS